MRKFLLSIVATLTWLSASALDGLTITPFTGDPVTFLYSQEPDISFIGKSLKITTIGSEAPVTLDMDNIKEITLGKSAGVEDLKDVQGIACMAQADGVIFTNIPANTKALVFSLDGRTTPVQTVGADGTLTLSRSELGTGIFIVKIGTFTSKVRL